MEIDIKEMEEALRRKQEQRERAIKETEEFLKLPFYLMLQAKGQEWRRKRFENGQLETMEVMLKRHYPSHKTEARELGNEFLCEFFNGDTKSINEFLLIKLGEREK